MPQGWEDQEGGHSREAHLASSTGLPAVGPVNGPPLCEALKCEITCGSCPDACRSRYLRGDSGDPAGRCLVTVAGRARDRVKAHGQQ